MSNHVHLIAVPRTDDGLARAIGEAHRRYTNYINARARFRGHLFQNRFGSVVKWGAQNFPLTSREPANTTFTMAGLGPAMVKWGAIIVSVQSDAAIPCFTAAVTDFRDSICIAATRKFVGAEYVSRLAISC